MKNLFQIILGVGWIGAICAQYGPRRPPNYSQLNMPKTSFSCRDKILGGYYADPETDCQMFHVCVKVPGQGIQDYKFLCPNNTSFDQENQICDDWFNIDCEASTLYYSDNFDLYRIGSEFEGNRVSPGVKLPTNIINNAVSDVGDDEYLRRSDRGESVGSDLLRGSHSSNFFSNRNLGREDEEDVKKVPATAKSGIRKLLTGKRPLSTQTSTLAPAPTTAQNVQVDPTTQRPNFAGRGRASSNFRGTFRNNNKQNAPASNSNQNAPAPNNNQNFPATNNNQNFPATNNNQNFPATNNNQNFPAANKLQNFPAANNNQNFPAANNNQNIPATNNQNFPAPNNNQNFPTANNNNQNFPATNSNRKLPTYNKNQNYFNGNQQHEPQRVNTAAPTTQRQNYYTTTVPTTQRQNFYPTTTQPPRQNYYSTEASTQRATFVTTPSFVQNQNSYFTTPSPVPSQQQNLFSSLGSQAATDTKAQSFATSNQNRNSFYSPSTQTFNQNYETTTQRNLQTFPTTFTPSGFSSSVRNPDQLNPQSQQINNYFETAKLYKLNIDAQNSGSGNVDNGDKYDDSSEFLKTAPSQNLGAANFNRIQNIYKGYNTSVGASYNTGAVNATTIRPALNYNVFDNGNRNTFVNSSPKASGFTPSNQFSVGYKEQSYSTAAPSYFSQSTTPKFVQHSYNGTTANRNTFHSASPSTQSPNTYVPTTQYNYYTTTTQKPYVQNQNNQFPTGHETAVPVTTIRPTNYYNPSAPATNFYNNQGTTRNLNEQTGAKFAGQKTEKKYSPIPTVNYSPSAAAQAQSSSTPFRGVGRGSAPPTDKTEDPRPFAATSTQTPVAPSKETKSEKEQYDYAYYDDTAHPEYENLDAIEFSKTKSKK